MKFANKLTILLLSLTLLSGIIWFVFDKPAFESVTAILGALSGLHVAIRVDNAILRALIALGALAFVVIAVVRAFPTLFAATIVVHLWVVLTVSTVVTAGVTYEYWRQARIRKQALDLNKLDSKLWRLLTELDDDPSRTEQSLELIADSFLSDLLEIVKRFHEGFRISVMRPEKDNKDYLSIWSSASMPTDTKERTRFYLGNDPDILKDYGQRGVAARTFLDGRIRTVRFEQRNDRWVADDPDHRQFVQDREPSYRSYVTVPIKDDSGHIWGVICLDSKYADACSSPEVQDLLFSVADRFAALMLFAHSLLDAGKP